MKVALITCSKAKRGYPCTAAEMYSPSTLFSLSYKYAQMVADKVFILSAKYGLLEETDPINPYNLNLKDVPYNRRLDWANYVISNLRLKCDLENDEFIILAGKNYYENLLTELTIPAPITTKSVVKTSLHTPPDNSISSKIRSYILFKFEQAQSSGKNECVLVSGEIHRALNLKNSMPTVCNVMAKLKRPGDEILHTTPSGMSSTIQIRYHLN